MLTDVLEWLYPYRNFFSFLIVFCSIVNNYLWLSMSMKESVVPMILAIS